MPRKVAYTQVTPIPSHIPRQLGIDMLHSHGELIELNPLVLSYNQIKPPRDAPADEYFSTWYEITERIQIIPGTGKLGSGKISFRGVYHDMPWGLQTHVYVPGGVDLRVKYSIRGNQPGEPPEARELGSQAPADGLYLREDIEIKCNFTMVSFVKKGMKEASKVMIARLIKKAELIDAEILRQMMDAHKLQDEQQNMAGHSPQPPGSPGLSATGQVPYSPGPGQDPFSKRHTMISSSDVLRKREESLRQALYNNGTLQPQPSPGIPHPNMMEMMGSVPGQGQAPTQQFHNSNPGLAIEMEGDTSFNHRSPMPSPNMQSQGHRASTYSELSGENGYNLGSRPQSTPHGGTEASSGWGGSQASSSSPRVEQAPGQYRYNPRDFASELPAGR
ncbi:uncharacterized protein HMPREF1541_09143 [Cyphellophora europaea CBS 101466]|uniref:DUF7053 domain-containing protein n=1 Tax=Cyphellophora europaea (strain CBS 101466) TaxID=1220924 RepID=W2S9G5_CYPE1|nr:uncharacterized protein HMPREF1541_09143 [Cyphellophora europaea CBS 101466]ETN45312.1 hypothetical protein HMPREF1541_09143 [Cyphellophora europaea CBS 101466]